jgi:hypothetical protein
MFFCLVAYADSLQSEPTQDDLPLVGPNSGQFDLSW